MSHARSQPSWSSRAISSATWVSTSRGPSSVRRIEPALLRQDPVDEAVDLLDEPDEVLRADARTAVQEDRSRP